MVFAGPHRNLPFGTGILSGRGGEWSALGTKHRQDVVGRSVANVTVAVNCHGDTVNRSDPKFLFGRIRLFKREILQVVSNLLKPSLNGPEVFTQRVTTAHCFVEGHWVKEQDP